MDTVIYIVVALGFAVLGFRLERLSQRVVQLERFNATGGGDAPPDARS